MPFPISVCSSAPAPLVPASLRRRTPQSVSTSGISPDNRCIKSNGAPVDALASARATLAVPDLVLDTNPRPRKAARNLDFRLPRALRLPQNQPFVCIRAALSSAGARFLGGRSSRVIHDSADNSLYNPAGARPVGRCRITFNRNLPSWRTLRPFEDRSGDHAQP